MAQFKVATSFEEREKMQRASEKAQLDSIQNERRKYNYDSLQNYIRGDAVYGIIGQKLMVKPYKEHVSAGDDGIKFFTSPSLSNVYCPTHNIEYRNEYDMFFRMLTTKKDSIVGRVFKVISVVSESDKDRSIFIELSDEKDTLYYLFNKNKTYSTYSFPFNIEGYIVKQTELKKKTVHVSKTDWKDYVEDVYFDFYTGKPIKRYLGEEWTFKEFIIDPKEGELHELWANSKGDVYDPTYEMNSFTDKEYSDRIKKKYGYDFWKAILNNKIIMGMPKSAVEESWGSPESIHSTSYGQDYWIYKDYNVYFDKFGKVRGWN